MNKPNQTGSGVAAGITVVCMILIVLMVGGGLIFFVMLRRSVQEEALQRAIRAEQMAMAAAVKQRHIAEDARSAAQQAASELQAQVAQLANQQPANQHPASLEGQDQNSPHVEPKSSDPSTATGDPPSTLDRLRWLVNHWHSADGAKSSEEHWIGPRGGLMLGVNRSIYSNGKASFEYLRIESAGEDQVVYHASPMGRSETKFPLVEIGNERVVFENPAHDFPRRISYWLDGDHQLHARIEGEINGQPRQQEWVWSAAP